MSANNANPILRRLGIKGEGTYGHLKTGACFGGMDEVSMRFMMCAGFLMVHLAHGFMDSD